MLQRIRERNQQLRTGCLIITIGGLLATAGMLYIIKKIIIAILILIVFIIS